MSKKMFFAISVPIFQSDTLELSSAKWVLVSLGHFLVRFSVLEELQLFLEFR